MFRLFPLRRVPLLRHHPAPFRALPIPRTIRRLSAVPDSQEGINVAHAQFLAGAPAHTNWEGGEVADELEGVSPGSGKRALRSKLANFMLTVLRETFADFIPSFQAHPSNAKLD